MAVRSDFMKAAVVYGYGKAAGARIHRNRFKKQTPAYDPAYNISRCHRTCRTMQRSSRLILREVLMQRLAPQNQRISRILLARAQYQSFYRSIVVDVLIGSRTNDIYFAKVCSLRGHPFIAMLCLHVYHFL